jgi:hypothetical protein
VHPEKETASRASTLARFTAGRLLLVGLIVFIAGRLVDLAWHTTHDEFETAADQLRAHSVVWLGNLLLMAAAALAVSARTTNRSRSFRHPTRKPRSTSLAGFATADPPIPHRWFMKHDEDVRSRNARCSQISNEGLVEVPLSSYRSARKCCDLDEGVTLACSRRNLEILGIVFDDSLGAVVLGKAECLYQDIMFADAFVAATGLAAVHYVVLLPPEPTCVERMRSRVGHGFLRYRDGSVPLSRP